MQVPDFGGVSGISYLDPSLSHPGEYFAVMIQALVKQGYEIGVSLRAAPYDFRYAPSKLYTCMYYPLYQLQVFLQKMKSHLRYIYRGAGNQALAYLGKAVIFLSDI